MITAIRPYTPQNRQRQNFKAFTAIINGKTQILDKSDIIKSEHTARKFTHWVIDGKVPKTAGNIKELFTSITEAIEKNRLGVSSYLEEIRDDIWKITQ